MEGHIHTTVPAFDAIRGHRSACSLSQECGLGGV